MNREIKFRCWSKLESKMLYAGGGAYGFMTYDGVPVIIVRYGLPLENKDYELMQFTGLKDKNGKEIYEGDIIYGQDGLFDGGEIVYFDNGFYVKNYHCNACPIPDEFEVVGNIYETPELLKK